METRLPDDFREFLKLCNRKRVKYLLVGGYAVGYYGYPRATGDLDLWIEASAVNARRVVDVLVTFGFGVPELSPELFPPAVDRRILTISLICRIEIETFIGRRSIGMK